MYCPAGASAIASTIAQIICAAAASRQVYYVYYYALSCTPSLCVNVSL